MMSDEIQEIIIAGDDHRVLSASAKMWALVYNDVFVPLEDFLVEADREVFLRHLSGQDQGWFPLIFSREPDVCYLANCSGKPSNGDPGGTDQLRVDVVRADSILAAYREAAFLLRSFSSILALSEDVFFEYRFDRDQIRLFNTSVSRFDEGEMSFSAFSDRLFAMTEEENHPALESFLNHIRMVTPRFAVSIPENLFNWDRTVTNTIIKGAVAHHEGYENSVIGCIHPQRVRGAVSSEVTYDQLTGLISKSDITQLAIDRIERTHAEDTAIAIVDVDYFKHVNDFYGHQYGDQVLKQIASIMETEVAEHGAVGRIGGDEFLVIFYHANEETLRAHLRSIKSMVNATFHGKGPGGDKPISISVGTASYPADARNYQELFKVADYCLYLAKEKGRNRYIIYTHGKHATLSQIHNNETGGRNLVNGRDDLPLGDVLTQIQFMVRYNKKPQVTLLLREFADRFRIPLVALYAGETNELLYSGGEQQGEAEEVLRDRTFLDPAFANTQLVTLGMTVVNNTINMMDDLSEQKKRLNELDIQSFLVIPFSDAAGKEHTLVFLSLHVRQFWNEQHYMYYRLFVDTLALYDFTREFS